MKKESIGENWAELRYLVTQNITAPVDRMKHYELLSKFEADTVVDEAKGSYTILGAKRAPAAKRNHHAFEGGWVYHCLEMWRLWLAVRPTIPNFEHDDHITNERVFKAILYHDLHKAHRTFKMSGGVWKVEYMQDRTDTLLTQDIKTVWMLGAAGITLDVEQLNVLLWAEGGFSEIKPEDRSVLAVLVYCLDELSGNVLGRIARNAYFGLKMD